MTPRDREGKSAGAGAEPDRGRRRVEGKVIELLPSAACRVALENRSRLVAHAAGATKTNFVRVRVGDRILVELSPHDASRGRIVKLLGKG
ncbi:MAG: translation initiation factor IF-1 [Bryobacterales bacterium]|nr:translation initiation factor IF-1 [Bryobacterales bacterium]